MNGLKKHLFLSLLIALLPACAIVFSAENATVDNDTNITLPEVLTIDEDGAEAKQKEPESEAPKEEVK